MSAERFRRVAKLESDSPAPLDERATAAHRRELIAALRQRFDGMHERLTTNTVTLITPPAIAAAPDGAAVSGDAAGAAELLEPVDAERVAELVNETRRVLYGPFGSMRQLERPPDVTAADILAGIARRRGNPGAGND